MICTQATQSSNSRDPNALRCLHHSSLTPFRTYLLTWSGAMLNVTCFRRLVRQRIHEDPHKLVVDGRSRINSSFSPVSAVDSATHPSTIRLTKSKNPQVEGWQCAIVVLLKASRVRWSWLNARASVVIGVWD